MTGGGLVTLAAREAYAGPTIASGGTLALAGSDAFAGTIGASSSLLLNGGNVNVDRVGGFLGTNARPVTLQFGALTASNGVYAHLAGPLTLAGGILAGGTPDATFGNWSLDAGVTVSADSGITAPRTQLGVPGGTIVDVATGKTLTVSGALEDPGLGTTGTGTLVKAGAGTLALAGRNTHRGPTIINAGKVKLQAPAAPVPGALYWLDASDPGFVVRDAAGNVSQWGDKSGNGRNFIQDTAAARPLYVANVLGGKPVVRFNGAGSQMIMVSNTTPLSTFIVTIPGSTLGGDRGIWGSWDQDYGWRQGTAGWYGDKNNADWPGLNTGDVYTNGVLGDRNNMPIAAGVPVLIEGIRTNGTAAFANTGIGRYSTVSGGGRYFQGDIAEILVYPSVLSAADRRAVEAYLMAKWLGAVAGGVITNDILSTNSAVFLAAGATLDLGGAPTPAIGSLSDQGGGGGLVTSSAATNSLLTLGHDHTDASFSGVIANGSGTVALVKVGLGIQTLGGISTYSGGTSISNGTLLVGGALSGTGVVRIAAGGTLGGTGLVRGAVLQDGTLSPGASIGTLTVSNQVTAGATAVTRFELGGTNAPADYDRLVVSAQHVLDGTLEAVTTNGYVPALGDRFVLITNSAALLSGTFAVTSLPALGPGMEWAVQVETGAVTLVVTGSLAGATIGGSVLRDVNGNGAVEAEDATNGLAGVTVTLAGSAVTNVALTDAAGLYTFTNLAADTYTVTEADPAGHVSTADRDGVNDNVVTVTVAGAESSTTNWFLDYALTAYELWAQAITNPALRGEQEDADGDGYANLLEYSQGSDPTNEGSRARLLGRMTNGVMQVIFNRVNTATELVYEVEGAYSPTNGAEWLGLATNQLGSWGAATNVLEDNTAVVHRVQVNDLTSGTNRTLRLKVTRP
jgi:autotransporter-associated beta strand protein